MKVLYYVGYPLAWAEGGHAIQIRETIRAVETCGVETGWLHPEDTHPPSGDVLHYFSRPPSDAHWQLARQRGLRLVISEIHQGAVLRPRWQWPLRGQFGHLLPLLMGRGFHATTGVNIYTAADAALALTEAEADYMRVVMRAPADRVHVVTNGVEPVFFDGSVPPEPFSGLLYAAYICERKNSIAVAQLAKRAGVPVKFVGPPLETDSAYARAFAKEVDDPFVCWVPEPQTRLRMAAHYRGACGSFLASQNEGLPLALLESLAAGTPVMAPDLPNLRQHFGDAIRYLPPPDQPAAVGALQDFYAACQQGLKQSLQVPTWDDVGRHVANIYRQILNDPKA